MVFENEARVVCVSYCLSSTKDILQKDILPPNPGFGDRPVRGYGAASPLGARLRRAAR